MRKAHKSRHTGPSVRAKDRPTDPADPPPRDLVTRKPSTKYQDGTASHFEERNLGVQYGRQRTKQAHWSCAESNKQKILTEHTAVERDQKFISFSQDL